MKYKTTRFGSIEVEPEEIVTIPEGPLGFPDCEKFVFVDPNGYKPLRALQSLDNPSLAFMLIDPLFVKSDYKFEITKEDIALIGAENTEGLTVYCIVCMSQKVEDCTANLQGPIVINGKLNIGHQYVLVDQGYTTRMKFETLEPIKVV